MCITSACKVRISPSAFSQFSALTLHPLVDEVYGEAVNGVRSLVMGYLQRFEGRSLVMGYLQRFEGRSLVMGYLQRFEGVMFARGCGVPGYCFREHVYRSMGPRVDPMRSGQPWGCFVSMRCAHSQGVTWLQSMAVSV